MAQTVPPDRGVPTRDEIIRPVQAPPQPPARLRIDGGVERSPCPLADPAYSAIRVKLTRASFSTLTGVTEAELEPLYRPFLGADRPISDVCEIRDVVATELRRRGYLAAVQVPPQRIVDGEVHFEVLYARLVAIRVRGDAGRSERLVAGYLDKLTRDPVFNQRTAERYLLLARDLPGIDVHLALKPTGKPGEVYGEITLVRTPIEADYNFQNFGSDATGPFGAQARIQFNGLTGLGDQTSLAFYSTAPFREQHVVQASHEFRVGGEGLQFGAHLTYAWTRPELAASPDVVRARTLFANFEARYPLLRTQAASLSAAGGLDYVNQTVRFADVPLARDRLRIAYLRIDGEMLDGAATSTPSWRTAYSLELRQGIDVFGATRWPKGGGTPPSRADGDARATLIRGSLSTEWRILPNVTWATTETGQYAFDPVLAFEEYSAGNYTIGRGYDPGTLLGDDGIGVSNEFRIDRLMPFHAPIGLQPFVFADTAQVWNKHGGHDELASVGGGLRASYADRARLDVTLAVPLRAAGFETHTRSPRILVSFTTKLWPFGGI